MKRGREDGSKAFRACVATAQRQLFKQLNEGGGCSYLDRVEGELRSRMDIAFTEKMSTSMIVVGPVGSGKKRLVESVLATYRADKGRAGGDKNSHVGIPVARVKGLVCTSDHQALCSIADQFLLRSGIGMEKHINIVLEDLESHFRQCMIDGHPAVVLLEDMHIFAGRDKQVLIYTLLDFMHKQDLLFVVIGLTPCAHLNSLLEKRVLSRLNAQFVYVPPVSGSDVLAELSRRLTLPADAEADANVDGNADSSEAGKVQGFAEYRAQFNARLKAMLSAQQGGSSRGSSSNNGSGGGGVPALAARYTEWGRGISHFLRAAQLAVSLLSAASPFLSAEDFESALHSQEPPGLAERLGGLPMLELLLFCAVARLYGRKLGMGATAAAAAAVVDKGADAGSASGAGAGAGGAGAGISDGDGGPGAKPTAAAASGSAVAGAGRSGGKKAATDVTIEEALREFDALSGGWLRKREIPTARAIGGLQALSLAGLVVLSNSGGRPAQQRLVSDKTLVLLVPAEYDVVAAFERRGQGQGQGRGPALVVSERVRRAVLEPLAPLT
jgi:hypothetical protein